RDSKVRGWPMDDPFTTELDEMSRAFDPANSDLSAVSPADTSFSAGLSADPADAADTPPPELGGRRGAPVSYVCPFCGVVNESMDVPCRQCGLENTHATRQATRSKIGPWFVWQARNPS